jgi:hypothetical protein
MRKSNIDNNRRKVQEKLGTNLAGPLEKYISQSCVHDILKELDVQFREAVFSPLGHVMGIYRSSSVSGSIM